MTERQVEKWLTPRGETDLMKGQCLKRKLYAYDISKVVVLLASEDASACTNRQYIVDDGRM
jgi:D-xylose 1-dehydrogenase